MASSMAISGLASGLDTDAIVEATMAVYRRPLDALEKQVEDLQFERQILRDLNDELYKLQQVSLNLRLESTFRSKLVTSSDESIVTATATTEALSGTHTVKVKAIAEAAQAYGDVTTVYRRTDLTSTAGLSLAGGETHGGTQGTHTVEFTSGRAGKVVGWVGNMNLDRTLGSYGVENAGNFTIRSNETLTTLTGIDEESTIREFIYALNTSGAGVVAEVRDGRVEITGATGGLDFSIFDYDDNYTDSIAGEIFGATSERLSVSQVIGSRSVTATKTLASLGVVGGAGMTFVVDGAEYSVTGFGGAATVQDLVDAINATVPALEAQIANNRLVISSRIVGRSFEIYGDNGTTDAAAQILGISGAQSTQGLRANEAAITVSASSGAHMVGGVDLLADSPLSSYGVTTANGLTITAEDGSTYTVDGLTISSTVQDLVDAINENCDAVHAQILGGRLMLYATDGGRNFTLNDVSQSTGGVASQLLGLVSRDGAASAILQSTSDRAWGAAVITDASDGKNGSVLGYAPAAGDLVLTNDLNFYGVTTLNGFTISVNGAQTTLAMAGTDTIEDLIREIDAIDGAKATLYRGKLLIEAEDGNANIQVSDTDYANGVAPRILGLTAARASVAEIVGGTTGLTGATVLNTVGVSSTSGFTLVVGDTGHTITGVASTDTVQDLIDAINTAAPELSASLTSDGRISVQGLAPGVNFLMRDADYSGTIASEVFGLTRYQDTLEPPTGNANVTAATTGAAIIGEDVSASGGLTSLLSAFGVSTTKGEFRFTYRGAEIDVSFDGSTDTLQDLIDRVNATGAIRADFVGGRFLVSAADPRENFTIEATTTTYNAGNGFRELLGLEAAQSTADDASGDAIVVAASTGEYTASDVVLSSTGGSPEFHAQVGNEGSVLDDLFDGAMLQGSGANLSFTSGYGYLYTTAELATGVETASLITGASPGQREAFDLTEVSSPTGRALGLVANAIYEGALSDTYYVEFTDATHYVLRDEDGNHLGDPVSDGAVFTAYADSALAGSAFTFTSDALSPPAPAQGDTWSFILGIDSTKTLAKAGFATPASASTNGTFTINGVQITIEDYATETVELVLAKINSAGAGVIAAYDPSKDQFLLSSTALGTDSEITLGSVMDSSNFLKIARIDLTNGGTQTVGTSNGTVDTTAKIASSGLTTKPTSGTFTINGVKLYVDKTKDTLDDVIERINNSGAGVIAAYDKSADRLVLKNDTENPNTKTNTQKIRVGSATDTSDFLQALRILTYDELGVEKAVGEAGKDATVVVDGITYTRTTNVIDDILTGVTLTLNGVDLDKTATIQVQPDTERGLEALADWVAKWNETVETLNPDALTDEQKKYLEDLTDDERDNMTFTEIETYEALHEAYTTQEQFRRDAALRRLFQSLWTYATDPITGLDEAFNSLTDLGIKTYTPTGELVSKGYLVYDSTDAEEILEKLKDNATLTAALRDNEEEVYELFAARAYEGSGTTLIAGKTLDTDGFTVPEGGGSLRFRVGDGTDKSAIISFVEGVTYSFDEVLEMLDRAGLQVANDRHPNTAGVKVTLSSAGTLSFTILDADDTTATVWFEELSTGTNTLETLFGIEVSKSGDGIGEYFNQYIKDAIASTGALGVRTRTSGTYDQRILAVQNRIDAWEDRLETREASLYDMWARFETSISRLQTLSDAVTSLSASLAYSSSSSSNNSS